MTTLFLSVLTEPPQFKLATFPTCNGFADLLLVGQRVSTARDLRGPLAERLGEAAARRGAESGIGLGAAEFPVVARDRVR